MTLVIYVDDIRVSSKPSIETGNTGISKTIDGGDDPHIVSCDSLFKDRKIDPCNFVDNSSFELGLKNWQICDERDTTITDWNIDDTQAFHGKRSLKIIRKGDKSTVRIRSQIMPLEKECQYILSCYAKSEDNGLLKIGNKSFATDSSWKRYSCIISGKKNGFIDLVQEGSGCTWIDAVQVEKGPLADFKLPPSVELGLSTDKTGNIYKSTDPVTIKINVFNATNENVKQKITYRILDLEKKCINEGFFDFQLNSNDGCEKLLKINLPPGYYHVSAFLENKKAETSLGIINPVSTVHTGNNSSFGFSAAVNYEPNLNRLFSIHSGMNGMKYGIIYHTFFFSHAKKDWKYDNAQWEGSDKLLSLMEKYNIIPVVELWGFPKWLAPSGSLIPNPDELTDEAIQEWHDYTYAVVKRYKDKVKYWEIFSEFVHDPLELRADMYMKLLCSASKAIRKADPDAVIIGFGQNTAANWSLLKSLEAHFKLGSLNYVDAVGIHPYAYPYSPEKINYALMIDKLNELIRKYNGGKNKDIWVTEVGWKGTDILYNELPYGEGKCYFTLVSELEQAQNMIRMNIISLAKGIKKFLAFSFTHSNINEPWPYSFINSDGSSPKVVYVAYNQMINKLMDTKFKKEIKIENNILCYQFEKEDGSPVIVIWNYDNLQKPMLLHLELTSEKVKVSNMTGTPVLFPQNYEIPITGSPVYIESNGMDYKAFLNAFEKAYIKK